MIFNSYNKVFPNINMDNIIELYTFWFENEQLWFNCSKEDDLLITKKYSNLLSGKIIDPSIESIILYDQIPRHIYRNDQ